MKRQVGIWRELALLGIALCCACDGKKAAPGVSETWDNVCVDMDKDGFGFQCKSGDDCDDANKEVHEDCSSCRAPAEGCDCEDGIEPVDCRLPYTVDTSGSLLCHTGTRYCRDGAWSGCEGVITFTVAPPARQLKAALIDPGAPPIDCNKDCDPGCHLIEDKLDTPFSSDAGAGTHVNSGDAGGVTISQTTPGSTYPEQLDTAPCEANDMPDCDGLPAPYDPDGSVPSGGGSHKVAFYDLEAGTERTKYFVANTAADSLDVYMYPGTGSGMDAALPALAQALTRGNFLPGAGALPDGGAVTCLDNNEDGIPDQGNMDAGIAGNVSCFVRDVRFGAGWFREIPFYGTSAYPYAPWDTEMYEHHHDISPDAGSVSSAMAGFRVRTSLNEPEAAMQGLWSVATGKGFYAGWDRPGTPARSGCPAGTFGYPCFRDEALPAVLVVSPAAMENGPPTDARPSTTPPTPAGCVGDAVTYPFGWCPPLTYPSYLLDDLKEGSEAAYKPLSKSAEDLANPELVGVIDKVLVTYMGDIATFKPDYGYSDFDLGDCDVWDHDDNGGNDAVFRFTVTETESYFFSGRGSRFDATLTLFSVGESGSLALKECSDDDVLLNQGDLNHAPEIEMILGPGEYVLLLKAFNRTFNKGLFQVTMGRRESPYQRSGVFAAKRWSGDGGVEQALKDEGIRVATLQVGDDPYLRDQALKLSLATGAVDDQGQQLLGHPLELRDDAGVPVSPVDFSPMGAEAVRVLRGIVAGTVMDVSLDLTEFQKQNPGFGVVVQAIDEPGNGCQGVADGSDADTIADKHLRCVASARPQFRLTLSNPSATPVPPSAEANGGYFMWMRVLGDERILIDRVRVYAVPVQVFTPTVSTKYYASGTYEQEVRANACLDDEVPVWGALSWKANLPAQTSIRFDACASEKAEDLEECELQDLLTLTPGTTGCSPGSACGEAGYCDANGTCIQIEGASCEDDEDCGAFGVCAGVAGSKHCGNVRETLDTYPVARTALQGKRFMRVSVQLNSSPDYSQAPTLLQWSINYHCVPRD